MTPIPHPGVEWELDANMARTGRWRRRQFYAAIGDKRPPNERKPCEWREGVPR
jgi:hypothetical protein